jgi:hypothetical protein
VAAVAFHPSASLYTPVAGPTTNVKITRQARAAMEFFVKTEPISGKELFVKMESILRINLMFWRYFQAKNEAFFGRATAVRLVKSAKKGEARRKNQGK